MVEYIAPLGYGEVQPATTAGSMDPAAAAKNKALEQAAGDFEAMFLYQLLKGMRENTMKSDLFGDRKAEDMTTSLLDQELSQVLSKGEGMGLKKNLLEQLSSLNGGFSGGGTISDIARTRADSVISELERKAAIRSFEAHEVKEAPKEEHFIEPIRGRISSGYGIRKDPIHGNHKFHKGMDIAAPEGTAIRPTMSGTVVFSGKRGSYGNVVEIRHDNGYISIYAHNKVNSVKEGDRVTTEDVIATVGSTGRSTGPHLHFELKLEGYAVNPVELMHFG